MEFTIEREKLLGAIQRTLGVVERKASLPILCNLLVTAGDIGISIAATDREIEIETGHEASVIKEGSLAIPAKKLYETIRELEGETVHLAEGVGATAVITCNKAVCRLRGLSADDFPNTDRIEFESFKMPASLLAGMIKKVCFAASTDDLRRNLCGVALQTDRRDVPIATPMLRMIATDGHRLAVVQADMKAAEIPLPDKGVIIPRKGVSEMRKIAETAEGDLRIGMAVGACLLESGNDRLRVSLIDGDFPDWRRVVTREDEENDVVIRLERAALLHVLRRMAVFSEAVNITAGEDKLIRLNASTPEVGEISDEIEAIWSCGGDRSVSFNVRYLIDAVEAVSDGNVDLRIPSGIGGCLIRGELDGNYYCVVMPLKN